MSYLPTNTSNLPFIAHQKSMGALGEKSSVVFYIKWLSHVNEIVVDRRHTAVAASRGVPMPNLNLKETPQRKGSNVRKFWLMNVSRFCSF